MLRETFEEVGLALTPDDLVWSREDRLDMIYAAHLPAGSETDIVFGSEGQGWCLMSPRAYIANPKNIPRFAAILQLYLDQ